MSAASDVFAGSRASVTTCRSAPVVLMTMSARASSSFNSSQGSGVGRSIRWPALGALEVAVEDDDLFRTCIGQVLKRFLGHLAGADDQDALVVEAFEDSRGEIGDRDAGDADAMTGRATFR